MTEGALTRALATAAALACTVVVVAVVLLGVG